MTYQQKRFSVVRVVSVERLVPFPHLILYGFLPSIRGYETSGHCASHLWWIQSSAGQAGCSTTDS